MRGTIRVNAPSVIGEVIDGEAVIMDLGSGHYFSTDGTGAVIWSGIERGLSRAGLVAMLAARYDADHAALTAAVDVFVGELCERQLVVELDVAPNDTTPLDDIDGEVRVVFVVPTLNTYADMEDLLLLDPIHDVDATGWPAAKPTDAATP